MADAREPTVYWVSLTVATAIVRNGMWNCVPMVFMIVPISKEQKSPCAMAPSASIPYLFREISISFRFRNALNFSIFNSLLTLIRFPSDQLFYYCRFRRILSAGSNLYLQKVSLTFSSSSRMEICCGQTSSHCPHFTHSSARFLP